MKVLLAVDGSKYSYAAVQSVAEQPWTEDTEYMILSVAESPYCDYALELPPEGNLQRIHCKLERVVARHRQILQNALPAASITSKVVDGGIAEQIVDMARQWGADIIVMGSRSRHGLSKFMLGSVSESVLSHAPCSVEIIRSKPIRPNPNSNSNHKTIIAADYRSA